MDVQKKILIIYRSGSGSTRTISEVFKERLSASFYVKMLEVYADFNYSKLLDYDIVLIGFPTYYFRPPDSILEFADRMPVLKKEIRVFLYTTYALYTGNSIRALAVKLKAKNMIVSGYAQIKGPASDGVLLMPLLFRLFSKYEKKANVKVNRLVAEIKKSLNSPKITLKMPLPRWYSPVTKLFSKWINSISSSTYKKNLKVLKDRCTNCNICVNNCIRGCWTEGKDYPLINMSNCEFCLRCVHNCPSKAIVFTDRMKDSPRLDKSFYKKLKQEAF